MKPRLLVPTCLAALLLARHSPAVMKSADPANAPGPAVVLQAKSVRELLVSLHTAAKNFLPEPVLKEVERDVLSKLDLTRLKGVDTKKPFGLYATFGDGVRTGDPSRGSVVILVPVSDKK